MTKVPVTVRRASPEDANSVSILLGELGYPNDEEFARKKLALLSSSIDRVFVAEVDQTVVGFISVHLLPVIHAPGLLAKVTGLVVSSAFRGRGAGRALMSSAEMFSAAQGATRIEIISGNHRSEAHAFYRKLSYTSTDQTRFIKDNPVS